jgi:hypothetical protein
MVLLADMVVPSLSPSQLRASCQVQVEFAVISERKDGCGGKRLSAGETFRNDIH